jgi:hypothetical protein
MRPIAALLPVATLGVTLVSTLVLAQTHTPGVEGGLPALAARVASLESLPTGIPVAVRHIEGRGNGLGCDLEAVGTSEVLLRARCNAAANPETPQFGLGVSLLTPVDMGYVYDGLYICGVVSPGLAERSPSMSLAVYFHELITAEDGSRLLQKRDTALNFARRGLTFAVPTGQLLPLEVDAASAGLRPCVTLRFADGQQSGDQPRLPGDIWAPTTQLSLFISVPPMLPLVPPSYPGDSIVVSEVGLTVAGRRPSVP